jgi:FkbM family methyltransferase
LSRLLLKTLRKLVMLVAKANNKLPAILEIDLQRMQGKGTGAGDSVEVEAKTALEFISRYGITEPVVLDIGANNGSYSEAILRAEPRATVFAFEPSSAARRKLEGRFLGSNSVKVVPFALGSAVSKTELWFDSAGSGLASLTKRRLEHFGIEFSESEDVEVTTLDLWVEVNKVVPNLVKMDVEGHELDVLNGGINTLALAQVVQFEFGGCNIDTKTFFQDFWYFFTKMGFALYRISKSGPIRILRYSEADECFRTTNYLAVRE